MEPLTAKQQQPVQTNFYYGWVIVAVASLSLFFSGPGQTYSISVFIEAYIQDFGWSRSMVSGIYSMATLLSGSLLFIVGRMIDRYGQRNVNVSVAVLLAVACFMSSLVFSPVMLFIGFFMLRLFGQGSMTLLPNTLVPQWFISKRGRAFSLMAIGGFLSSAAFPPINAWLIGSFGWRTAWIFWGTVLIVIFVPIALFFIRNKPEDIGLLPDNVATMPHTSTSTKNELVSNDDSSDWTLKEAMKTRAFWLILLCVGIPSMVNTGLTFHLLSILGEGGVSTTTAALILSLMAIIGFPVTLISGFIMEKVKVHYVLASVFVGELVFITILYFSSNVVTAVIFGVVWGITHGFERIAVSIIWPNYFGRTHIGSIKGVAMTATIIGSAFGPLPFGVAYDYFGGYQEILIMLIFTPVIGIVCSLLSPPPKKDKFV